MTKKVNQVADILRTMDYGPAPEADNVARAWIAARSPFGMWINNAWVKGQDHFDSVAPATGKPLAKITQATNADVDAAVSAARSAFSSWSKAPGHVRARYLYALARNVRKNSRLLAELESLDNGKPIRETRDIDIPLVARHFAHHAGWAQLLDTEFRGYKPAGVAGQIIPWNFPLLMLAWKIAPALAAGCTVVLKPAEFTSITALAFAEICAEVNLPPGVVNIVTGDGRVGEIIVNHPGIDKIAFTGSTEVGRLIRSATAGSGKKLSLELGGKSPFIVFDDADLDSAVEGVVDAIWFNQGQVCCAGSRLIVQESIADKLVNKLRERMERLRIGDPLDKAVDMGAIIAPVQLEKIRQLVEQGVAEGASMWQPSWACPTDGYFYPPTLFTNVAPAATIAQLEIFGPVLVTLTFRTPVEAIAVANNTRYGLAASVWTENLNTALDAARAVKAGTVWVNSTNLFDAASGFGGYRESGYGREGGKEGMYEYLKPVADTQRIPSTLATPIIPRATTPSGNGFASEGSMPPLDRTPKLFIKGKQTRPDSGYSRAITGANGAVIGHVGEGNRKDIRNAVEAARAASESWADSTGYNRAQILYYLAENLSARAEEFAARIATLTSAAMERAAAEVEAAIERLFQFGAWADKYDGAVHHTPLRNVTATLNEPIGVIGIICPDTAPLLGLLALVAPALATANAIVVIPSERYPLCATDFYQVMETSDVPPGTVNIVTGSRDVLAKTLTEHDDVDAVWYCGDSENKVDSRMVHTNETARMIELASIGNLKRTWIAAWPDVLGFPDVELLRQSLQIKNIWTPYGA